MKNKKKNDLKSKHRKPLKKIGAVFCVFIIFTILFYFFIYEKPNIPPNGNYDLTLKFPRDEGAHEQMSEVWTFSGFLESTSGHSFGYQVSYFNSGIREVAFTDQNNATGKKYYSSRNFPDDVRDPSLNIEVSNESLELAYQNGLVKDVWQAVNSDEYNLDSIMFYGSQELVKLNITLNDKKAPVPLGDENGKTYLNESGTIHSYFQSGVDVSGTIFIYGTQYNISGQAWIEHAWGDWTIFNTEVWSIVLSNDEELYVSKIYDQESIKVERYYTVSADGSFEVDFYPAGGITYSDFTNLNSSVQNLKYWLDPNDTTGQRAYSSLWRIVSERLKFNLTVEPTVDNQKAPISWVGTCSVNGIYDGKYVTGKCYANLAKRYASTLTVTNVFDDFENLEIPNDPVTVVAQVSDDLPITEVTLFYRINNGTEHSVDMVDGELGWAGTIPGQSLGTDVEYWIVAKDLADKTLTTDSYYYKVEI